MERKREGRWIHVTEKLPEMHMQKHSIDCHSDVVTVTRTI